MKINNYFINQLHVLIQLHYYQDYPPRLSSKAQLSPSIFTLLSPILFCTFFMFISTYKSSGQCSGSLSGYNQNFTYTENALYGEICAGFTAVYLGGYNKVGIIEITYPHPVSYVQFEICSLSSGPVNSEHLEVWVDGALYDLNKASVAFTNTQVFVTSPGNLGVSGISGVIEPNIEPNNPLINARNGSALITFPCGVKVLEVRHVHKIGHGNGSFILPRYCTTPSTLGSCLCTDRQLVISKTKIADCPTNILASVKVFNPGSDVLPSGTPITFYDGDPTLAGATPIITYTNTPAIPANGIQNIADIDIGVCDLNTVHLFAVLGDDGSNPIPLDLSTPLSGTAYTECDYTNNISGFKLKERCSQFGEIISK